MTTDTRVAAPTRQQAVRPAIHTTATTPRPAADDPPTVKAGTGETRHETEPVVAYRTVGQRLAPLAAFVAVLTVLMEIIVPAHLGGRA